MFRIVPFLALLLFAAPVLSQTVKVSSGDHPDFTRIVLEFAGPVDWTMGRTADGYELRLPGDPVQYDLSKVFNLIQRNRLAAIWADPDTAALHFSVACACFAMPFEFRPGTVVIDIRNGVPPKGSSFEQPLDGSLATIFVPRPTVRPAKRPSTATSVPDASVVEANLPAYNWTEVLLNGPTADGVKPDAEGSFDLTMTETPRLDLEPLRQSLIEQLSRGASQGIVDMAKPQKSPESVESQGSPSVAIRIGDAPNLVVRQKGEAPAPLTAKGAECVADDRLEVSAWAEDTPILEQIGPVLSGLTGEFDIPDPEAVKRAVRFYLNLGFGAEARAVLRALPTEQEDAAIWHSMARILDGQRDPDPAFAGMAACDTSAALWAVLSDPETLAVGQVEKAAILRAFSALPNHLRRQLGRTLVDRFLGMQDFATAIALRDAVLRGTTTSGPETELMQAAIERAGGSPSASASRLEEIATESGPKSAEALLALVVQRAELGQDVSFEQVLALEEFAKEREGSVDHDAFRHALTLAYAASGDFETAFDRLADDPQAAPTFWQILGSAGPDSALLAIATLADRQPPPSAAAGAASLIATRMLTLGLADQAARWLKLAEAPPVLLAARILLAEGRPQEALDLLTNDTSPGALSVQIEAHRDLGDDRAVADLFETSGMTEEQWRTISRMQDWESLADSGPDVWKTAAEMLVAAPLVPTESGTVTPVPPGPLAKGQALLVNSLGTREAIGALLEAVQSPAQLTQ